MWSHAMPDQDHEKKKPNTPREADSGGNAGAGKSGKEGMGIKQMRQLPTRKAA